MEACSEIITCADMAKIMSEVSQKKVETVHMPKEAFYDESLKKKISPELWINYRIFLERWVRFTQRLTAS